MNDLAKPVEQTAAWLYRAARNKIIDSYKKKKDIPFSALAEIDDEDAEDISCLMDLLASANAAEESTPETEMLASLVWDEIEAALEELPEDQRTVFVQTEFLDLPVKEIAQKSGVPVNTLLSRKHYAVVFLRKRLRDLYTELMGG
jgi:RNA polymerase sigma factor (sigma-70 family)